MYRLSINIITIALFTFLLPGIAYANAGVPMLFLAMPAFAISLLPIIAIEAIYLSKSMDLNIGRAARTAGISNFVSTIIGIPLTWFILVALQMITGGGSAYGIDSIFGKILAVTWQAPWLIPYEKDLDWMISVAGVVLLVPFFFASWWSEYFVSKKILPEYSPGEIKTNICKANLITYGLLGLWPIGIFVFNHA